MSGAEGMALNARAQTRMREFCLRALVPGVVCMLLGVLLVVQFRTQRALGRTSAPAGSASVGVLGALVEGNARLRQERATLERQIAEHQQISGQERLTALVEELTRLRIANGLVETSGPGIEVRVEDSLSPLEIQDLVNELRNVGAEAIALNGQRLVTASVIASRGETLMVDGELLVPPYLFQAIGSAQDMQTAMVRQGGLIMLLAQTHEGRGYAVVQRDQISLAVFTRPLKFEYARPVE